MSFEDVKNIFIEEEEEIFEEKNEDIKNLIKKELIKLHTLYHQENFVKNTHKNYEEKIEELDKNISLYEKKIKRLNNQIKKKDFFSEKTNNNNNEIEEINNLEIEFINLLKKKENLLNQIKEIK